MKISYCTNCGGRLWQLKQTIDHNLSYTIAGEVELCVLAYNDEETEKYLRRYYQEYIDDGRLKVKSHFDDYKPIDGSSYACGYVKHLAHQMASGEILFNLDADNFICDAHEALLKLKPNEVIKYDFFPEGSSGRIGVYKDLYYEVGGYRDKGRADDGDFIIRCLKKKARIVKMKCKTPPIKNERLK